MGELTVFDVHISLGNSISLKPATGITVGKAAYRRAWGYPNKNNGISEGQYDLSYAGNPSGWHSFAREWSTLTPNEALYLVLGTPNSSLIEAAASSAGLFWDHRVSGGLYDGAKSTVANFESVLASSPRFSGNGRRFVHWELGGIDAKALGGTAATGDLYQAALESLVAQSLSDFKADRFLIHGLGLDVSGVATTGYDILRARQVAVAAAHPQVDIIFSKATAGTANLVVDGNGAWVSGWSYSDNYHYTAAAYNASGILAAHNLAAIL